MLKLTGFLYNGESTTLQKIKLMFNRMKARNKCLKTRFSWGMLQCKSTSEGLNNFSWSHTIEVALAQTYKSTLILAALHLGLLPATSFAITLQRNSEKLAHTEPLHILNSPPIRHQKHQNNAKTLRWQKCRN